MSFPRYPKYKDSGVEWLGQVPEHWETSRLGFLASRIGSGKTPAGGADNYQDHGVLFLRSQNVYDEGLRLDDVVYISEDTDRDMVASRVEPRDILLNITGASLGRTCVVPKDFEPANVNQHVCVIRLREPAAIDYVSLLLKSSSVKAHLDYIQNGAAREGLNFKMVSGIACPLPPIEERERIAAFLDRETAKIDALIAEQQRLIELLQEKRQAVISHAVTKGLNPDARMKDSGIEWLGKVPEHWEVKRLRYLGSAITGLTYSPSDVVPEGMGTLVLRSSNVQRGRITWDDNVFVSSDIPDELVTREGDILLCSRNGSRALIGKNAVIDAASAGLTWGAFMTVVRSECCDYLACVFNSPLFDYQSGSFLTSTINQLTIGALKEFEIPLPPAMERSAIVEFVQEERRSLNSLAASAERAIELLQERRSALISAAVTGQIDVRGLAGSEAA